MLLSPRFSDALGFAASLHREQLRKVSGTPYLGHLLAVAAIVLEHGGGEDEAIAALLHDAIEDQGGPPTREEIRRRFGARVVEIVDGCTDTDVAPKPPWRARKEAHLAHLRTASPAVCLVVAADKLDNSRSLLREFRRHGPSLWDHFRGGRDGTLWYLRTATEALQHAAPPPLSEELDHVVSELESAAGGVP
jgi:GTP pyrophosphokinase